MAVAACADHEDKDLWFPEPDEHERAAEAKAICTVCPARASCLAFSYEFGAPEGIWGALDRDERVQARRNQLSRESKARRRARNQEDQGAER